MSATLPAAWLEVLGTDRLRAEGSTNVEYRLGKKLGGGATATAFVAGRSATDGTSLCVVKILNPEFVCAAKEIAHLTIQKELMSLRRLNDRVPPTAHVVRLLDGGMIPPNPPVRQVALPWIALEYVHGGPLGTTLAQRVAHTVESTGYAFDPARAARAVSGIVHGLTAVHDMGIVHRDIKPDNVLCCGHAERELLKVSDFGIARNVSLQASFGPMMVGTPGYAAPELVFMESNKVGPWSDGFSVGSVIFHLLTGEDLFPGATLQTVFDLRGAPTPRRSIRESTKLHPDLRGSDSACNRIDDAIARATASDPGLRFASVALLGAEVTSALESDWGHGPVSSLGMTSDRVTQWFDRTSTQVWKWQVRHQDSQDFHVQSVDWDAAGGLMAATSHGVLFWDGMSWRPVVNARLSAARDVAFVRRYGTAQWLVGTGSQIAVLAGGDVERVILGPEPNLRLERLSGDIDDLAVAVGSAPGEPPQLCALCGGRWLRPLPVEGLASISVLTRSGDATWLVAGRTTSSEAFLGTYRPLRWELSRIDAPPSRALLAGVGDIDADRSLLVGTEGWIVTRTGASIGFERVPEPADLSACALDAVGNAWVAAAGRIWSKPRNALANAPWSLTWREPQLTTPFVALLARGGSVLALCADGSLIEGHTQE